MKRFTVRAEIIGEFVNRESFDTRPEAEAWYTERVLDGVYDNIDIWEE